jgi:hypothetical protein
MTPPESHTVPKQVRIPDKDWARFEETAGTRKRASVIVEFIRWYNREPGAKLPKRPSAESG